LVASANGLHSKLFYYKNDENLHASMVDPVSSYISVSWYFSVSWYITVSLYISVSWYMSVS
jgi:maltodextrin utilization protein YvdJ